MTIHCKKLTVEFYLPKGSYATTFKSVDLEKSEVATKFHLFKIKSFEIKK